MQVAADMGAGTGAKAAEDKSPIDGRGDPTGAGRGAFLNKTMEAVGGVADARLADQSKPGRVPLAIVGTAKPSPAAPMRCGGAVPMEGASVSRSMMASEGVARVSEKGSKAVICSWQGEQG